MLKKILAAALMLPLVALAQSYPSPTFKNVTVNGTFGGSATVGLANGGTGAATASAARTNLGVPSTGVNTFTGSQTLSGTGGIALNVNDTSGSTHSNIYLQNQGTVTWGIRGYWSNLSQFQINRYSGGTLQDTPFQISNSTGVVTFADGITSTAGTNTLAGGTINNMSIGATTPSTIAASSYGQNDTLTTTGVAGNCSLTIPTTNYCVNYWQLGTSTADNAALSDPTAFVNDLAIVHNYGGSQMTGGRQTFYVQSTLTSPSSASNGNRNYVAGEFYAQASSGDGGTGTTSTTAKGGIFALSPVAVAYSGATNLLELTGAEVNTQAMTGSSMYYKAGWTIVQTGLDAVQGSSYDAGIGLSNQTGAVGWQNGILFGPMNGQFPIASTGCLICSTGSATAATGIDFSSLTLTNFLHGPGGFYVNGTGGISASAIVDSGPLNATSGTFSSALSATSGTFSSTLSAAYSNAAIATNDTSSTNSSNLFWQKNGTPVWNLNNVSSSGTLNLGRYVSGTFTDNPISVSDSTGVVSFVDGISTASLTSTGAISGTTGTFSGVLTPQAGIAGITSGTSAAAGIVGEDKEYTTSGTSLTTGTAANSTSGSLAAGDWEVTCTAQFTPAASTTMTQFIVGVNTTSATLPAANHLMQISATFNTGSGQTFSTPPVQVIVSAATTVYCPVSANFGTSTMTVTGYLHARRLH